MPALASRHAQDQLHRRNCIRRCKQLDLGNLGRANCFFGPLRLAARLCRNRPQHAPRQGGYLVHQHAVPCQGFRGAAGKYGSILGHSFRNSSEVFESLGIVMLRTASRIRMIVRPDSVPRSSGSSDNAVPSIK